MLDANGGVNTVVDGSGGATELTYLHTFTRLPVRFPSALRSRRVGVGLILRVWSVRVWGVRVWGQLVKELRRGRRMERLATPRLTLGFAPPFAWTLPSR